ncbi:MAG: hypothetical protein NTW21_28970 [Verrucomicrobia bacterium]|nr:hypothetical protein [Verrucomicrobiota bacterium]
MATLTRKTCPAVFRSRRVMAWLLPLLVGPGLGIGCPACVSAAPVTTLGVEFPGPPPGKARATQRDGAITLGNDVLAVSWSAAGNILRPVSLSNKLTGQAYSQDGCEVFRLATGAPTPKVPEGVAVTIRLAADALRVLVSRDGLAWSELATYPRAEFPGAPKLVRIGKMNRLAEAKNYSTDGPPGEGCISELSPRPTSIPTGRFDFKASAHEARTAEYPFPAGSTVIGCRIDKGTDQGLTWGPAIALIWEEGKRFLLVGVRDKTPVFNLSTAAGERIVAANLGLYPGLDLPASAFRLTAAPRVIQLDADPAGIRLGERLAGLAVEAAAVSDRGLRVRWRAELRDGCGYLRQTLELTSPQAAVPLLGVEFADLRVPEPRTVGTSPGCPVVAGNLFFGVEMPGARNALSGSGARIGFSSKLELAPAQSYAFGAVCGVAPAGQLRRAFLHYLERERARPSKPFLHYNCWYDLGYGLNATDMLDSHWVGGDPLKLEVYGYAAWNRRKATLMLRNPDERPQTLTLDAAAAFELPAGAPAEYRLTSPYRDQRVQAVTLIAGQPQVISLEPFEVLVFDAFGKGPQPP